MRGGVFVSRIERMDSEGTGSNFDAGMLDCSSDRWNQVIGLWFQGIKHWERGEPWFQVKRPIRVEDREVCIASRARSSCSGAQFGVGNRVRCPGDRPGHRMCVDLREGAREGERGRESSRTGIARSIFPRIQRRLAALMGPLAAEKEKDAGRNGRG